jgi:hypothetical protein
MVDIEKQDEVLVAFKGVTSQEKPPNKACS